MVFQHANTTEELNKPMAIRYSRARKSPSDGLLPCTWCGVWNARFFLVSLLHPPVPSQLCHKGVPLHTLQQRTVVALFLDVKFMAGAGKVLGSPGLAYIPGRVYGPGPRSRTSSASVPFFPMAAKLRRALCSARELSVSHAIQGELCFLSVKDHRAKKLSCFCYYAWPQK